MMRERGGGHSHRTLTLGRLRVTTAHLRLLHGDVHVAIQGAHDPAVIHPGVQLHQHLLALDRLQKVRGGFRVRHRGVACG